MQKLNAIKRHHDYTQNIHKRFGISLTNDIIKDTFFYSAFPLAGSEPMMSTNARLFGDNVLIGLPLAQFLECITFFGRLVGKIKGRQNLSKYIKRYWAFKTTEEIIKEKKCYTKNVAWTCEK